MVDIDKIIGIIEKINSPRVTREIYATNTPTFILKQPLPETSAATALKQDLTANTLKTEI